MFCEELPETGFCCLVLLEFEQWSQLAGTSDNVSMSGSEQRIHEGFVW